MKLFPQQGVLTVEQVIVSPEFEKPREKIRHSIKCSTKMFNLLLFQNILISDLTKVIQLQQCIVRSAGSVPVKLRRTGFADCPVTISAAVMLENQEILVTQVTFQAGQVETSFEIPIEKIPRKTEIDNYRVVITEIISDHPTKPPETDTVFQIQNDIPRSQVRITAADSVANQSAGKANFKMERLGNIDGDLTANYSIFGGPLDGHRGSVTMADGVREMDFDVDLPRKFRISI